MGPTEWLLLDVGGTFIKCSDSRLVPVDSGGDREGISAALRSAVLPVCRAADEGKSPGGYGIAVAVPGPFDYGKGIFLMRHKFLSVYGESFRSLAGVPDEVVLRFAHDVNSMLRGEICQGNGRYGSRVALVTLGTGLGFALSIDGTILENSLGAPLISV
ncbi:MAG: ROK family protein, partial [Candidatus Cryptobacteroides sp.]